jgi:hypothetical protein
MCTSIDPRNTYKIYVRVHWYSANLEYGLDRNAGAQAIILLVNCSEIVYVSQLVDILHTIISSISKKYFYFVGLQTECQISVDEHATGIYK